MSPLDRENLAADVLNRAFPGEHGGDGVALTNAFAFGGNKDHQRMAANILNGPLTVRWLQCKDCGWRLPDGAAGYPECAECGGPLHIHRRPA
jgi:hypothetical protein